MFEKIVKFNMPFDKRSKDPKKNYGIGSFRIRFILKKGEKAVQVVISTQLYPAHIIREHIQDCRDLSMLYDKTFDCWEVGYHSNKPMYSGQSKPDCDILKKGSCYYGGSCLRGRDDKVAENFEEHGVDWVWKYLEKYWYETFGNRGDNKCTKE